MKNAMRIRRSLALLLTVVLLFGSSVPGRAAELTEPTEETTAPTVPETETTVPEETTLPQQTTLPTEETIPQQTTLPTGETIPEQTTLPTEETIPQQTTLSTEATVETTEQTVPMESTEETLPEETEEPLYRQLLSRMEALREEAEHLSPELQTLNDFSRRLRDTWNEAYDACDQGLITDGELAALDEIGWEILTCLKDEYRYEDGVIAPLAIQRHGSRETPMAATAENSVASLGSGSGIKFRIFNYTNGQDASGNYITSGGINDNGLSGYFDFRGTSYENTGADGTQVSNFTNSVTDIDGYTANHATVLPNLGSDGYPVFDGSRDNGPQKSLGYLFGAGGKGVTGYAPGNTLLRQNSRGQYYYNSADNAVDFDPASNRFIVRTYRERGQTTANQGSGQYYDFFPFTYWNGTTKEASGTANWYNYNNTAEVDYWYGMTMEAAFSMPEGGLVQGDEMVFEFSGDDDVWVFIDDVLVLDLGGTHGVVSGSINFATGAVKQYLDWGGAGENSAGTSYPTTLKACFDAAGKEPRGGWSGNVFADYTEHTIKFYYLERATSCANCKILFNMPILPTGKLTVEKEIEGTLTAVTAQEAYGFTLVQKTDSGDIPGANIRFDRIDGATGAVLETGTTEEDGGFTLKAGQRAEFDLTAGKTFLIRETDTGRYAEAAQCTVNGAVQVMPEETGEITIDPNSPAQAVFTNRLKTTSFSVSKQVAGNLGDRDQEFAFRARLYTGDPGNGGSFTAFPAPGTGDGYALRDGEAHFQLKHGQTILLDDLPVGVWVTVTEELAEGYETTYKLGESTGTGRTVQIEMLTEPVPLSFTNTREVLINTGVHLDTIPYLLMTAAGTLPLMRRRRKKESL